MGLLKTILGLLSGSQTSASKPATTRTAPIKRADRNVELDGEWLNIHNLDFFGSAFRSSDGKWVLAWADHDGQSKGGYRENGNGKVVLVDYAADKVIQQLSCFARPDEGAVGNSGNFIIHDAGFGSALQGALVAMNPQGQELYRRRFKANIINIGLSDCGRYAAVQTANSPGSADSNILEVADITSKQVIFSGAPATGWADHYAFDVSPDGELLAFSVVHKKLGRFSYLASGEFQDAEAYDQARLTKGDYSTKIMAARDILKTSTAEDTARIALQAAETALTEGAAERPDWCALAHRVRGEAYEILNKLPEALQAYDLALALDSKIGIQKRATALRKKLGAHPIA